MPNITFSKITSDHGLVLIIGGLDIDDYSSYDAYKDEFSKQLISSAEMMRVLTDQKADHAIDLCVILPHFYVSSNESSEKKRHTEIAEPLSKKIIAQLKSESGKDYGSFNHLEDVDTDIQVVYYSDNVRVIWYRTYKRISNVISDLRNSKSLTHVVINAQRSKNGLFNLYGKDKLSLPLLIETKSSEPAILRTEDTAHIQIYITSDKDMQREKNVIETRNQLEKKHNIKLLTVSMNDDFHPLLKELFKADIILGADEADYSSKRPKKVENDLDATINTVFDRETKSSRKNENPSAMEFLAKRTTAVTVSTQTKISVPTALSKTESKVIDNVKVKITVEDRTENEKSKKIMFGLKLLEQDEKKNSEIIISSLKLIHEIDHQAWKVEYKEDIKLAMPKLAKKIYEDLIEFQKLTKTTSAINENSKKLETLIYDSILIMRKLADDKQHFALSYQNQGILEALQLRHSRAIRLFNRALSLDPTPYLYFARAKSLRFIEKPQRAAIVTDLQEIIKMKPERKLYEKTLKTLAMVMVEDDVKKDINIVFDKQTKLGLAMIEIAFGMNQDINNEEIQQDLKLAESYYNENRIKKAHNEFIKIRDKLKLLNNKSGEYELIYTKIYIGIALCYARKEQLNFEISAFNTAISHASKTKKLQLLCLLYMNRAQIKNVLYLSQSDIYDEEKQTDVINDYVQALKFCPTREFKKNLVYMFFIKINLPYAGLPYGKEFEKLIADVVIDINPQKIEPLPFENPLENEKQSESKNEKPTSQVTPPKKPKKRKKTSQQRNLVSCSPYT